MDNETKITNEQINSLIEDFSSDVQKDSVKVDELLNKHLTKQQSDSLKNFLQDEEKVRSLLSSPLAKAFMAKYMKNGE